MSCGSVVKELVDGLWMNRRVIHRSGEGAEIFPRHPRSLRCSIHSGDCSTIPIKTPLLDFSTVSTGYYYGVLIKKNLTYRRSRRPVPWASSRRDPVPMPKHSAALSQFTVDALQGALRDTTSLIGGRPTPRRSAHTPR